MPKRKRAGESNVPAKVSRPSKPKGVYNPKKRRYKANRHQP